MKCTPEELLKFEKDSAYHDLGVLPSLGIPYGGNLKVYIRPFKLTEMRLLSKAVELGEVEHLLRAVDNTITVPVDSLTIGDFFYILLWLRLHSMPKAPYVVEWKCEQPYFTNKETRIPLFYTDANWPSVDTLKTAYIVEPCNTENTSIVHQANVEILTLPEDFSLPEGYDYPRMSCYQGRAAAMKEPELAMLAPAIQWLPGLTWDEKMSYAELNPDAIGEALDLNRKVIHGISEQVTFNCRRCRVEHSTKIELNALSFFR